jgi:hypothetical protein
MRIVTEQEAQNINRVINMTTAGPAEIVFLKEMTQKYLGSGAVISTCWNCPQPLVNTLKRLIAEIKDYKIISHEHTTDNGSVSLTESDPNTKQNKKRTKSRTKSNNI